MSHFSHDVPYIESKSEIFCYILFHHSTNMHKLYFVIWVLITAFECEQPVAASSFGGCADRALLNSIPYSHALFGSYRVSDCAMLAMHLISLIQLCPVHRQRIPVWSSILCPFLSPWCFHITSTFYNIHSSRAAQRSSTGLPVESNKLPFVSACFVETKSQLDSAAANG